MDLIRQENYYTAVHWEGGRTFVRSPGTLFEMVSSLSVTPGHQPWRIVRKGDNP